MIIIPASMKGINPTLCNTESAGINLIPAPILVLSNLQPAGVIYHHILHMPLNPIQNATLLRHTTSIVIIQFRAVFLQG